MNNFANKYNRFLINLFVVAPIVAFIVFKLIHSEFEFIMRFLSFFGVILVLLFRNNSNPVKFPLYLLFYLLFILYVYFSTFILLDREFKFKYIISDPLIGSFNFLFIIENLQLRKRDYEFIIKASKIILVFAILVIVIQEIVDASFFVRDDLHIFDEVTSWGATQNRLLSIYSWIGGYLAIGYGFTPVFLLVVEDLQKHKKKILIWVIGGVIFAFLSKARWIMINTLLVFILLIIHNKSKGLQFIKLAIFIPLFFISSVILLEAIGVNAKGIINERILESDKKSLSQKSASTRILAFKAFSQVFWDQPFFGMGDKKYGMGSEGRHDYKLHRILGKKSAQIHVGYLALLYRFGIIGGFLFLSFTFLQLKRLYKNAKKTKIWAPFLGILGFALGNLTQVHFAILHMGLIIVLVADKYYQQKYSDTYS